MKNLGKKISTLISSAILSALPLQSALNDNANDVNRHLTAISPTGLTDLDAAITTIQGNTGDNLNLALDSVGGAHTGDISQTNHQLNASLLHVLANKHHPCRENCTGGALAKNVYFELIGQYNSQDNRFQHVGYDTYSLGGLFGVEFDIGERTYLTGVIGYVHTNLDWERFFGKTDTESLVTMISLTELMEDYTLQLTALLGFSDHDVTRTLHLSPTETRAAVHDHTAFLHAAHLGLSRDFFWHNLVISPYAYQDMSISKEDSYQESKAGDLSLNVCRRTSIVFRTDVGARICLPILFNCNKLKTSVKASWVGVFHNNGDNLQTKLADGSLFETKTRNDDMHFLSSGAQIAYTSNSGNSISLNYEFDMSFDGKSIKHEANISAAISF